MAIRTKSQETLYRAATIYSNRGWSVIPIEAGTKKARVAWAGYQNFRPGGDLLRYWWATRWPGDGVGVICGAISGIVVLDIDNPELAAPDLERFGGLPKTPTVITAKGRHYYFKWPGEPLNGKLPWGDFKGDGGYVLAPPSIHPVTKQPYVWEVSARDCPLAACPSWLLDLVRQHRASRQAVEGEDNGGVQVAPPVEESIPAGQRNQTLASIAGTMRRRGMTPEEIYPSLGRINLTRCVPPLPEAEVRLIADSMARYAPASPIAAVPAITEPQAQALNALPLSDAGNGEALAQLHGEQLRFDHSRQTWLLWDDVRWAPDRDGGAGRIAKATARLRQQAAALEGQDERRKALAKWAAGSESRQKLTSMLALGSAEFPLAVTGEQFDANEWLLACKNGVLDLVSGELLPGEPDMMLTLSTGVLYDPRADCPRWMQFLDEVFQGDGELIHFIQRAVGYTLSGSTREQCLFLCCGPGSNGKTVFLSVLHSILGEYAHNADFATFLDVVGQSGSAATPDLIALKGARMVTASEVKEDRRLNEARLKSLTGGDAITARPLYGRPITFTPGFKLWLAVNHRPVIRETGMAIWRRVRLIPFRATFPPETCDPDLASKLRAEAPGILAWALGGCLAWQADGLPVPAAVAAETAQYREAQDIIAAFLEACCDVAPGHEVRAGTLYQAYRRWCQENGEKALSSHAFGARMIERFARTHTRSGEVYHGVGLLDIAHAPIQEALL